MTVVAPTTALASGKISADAHVNEPRELWRDNLPASMRERAMEGIAADDDGGWSLILEGQHVVRQGEEESDRLKMLDAEHRYEIMREEGVAGECVFPTIGLYVWMLDDPAGGQASCRIYNEYMADGLARSPRFKCAGLVPTWTLESALEEVEFIAGSGLGSFMLPTVSRPGPPWNYDHWDPMWSAIEEADLPVVMHQGTGHSMQYHRGPGAAVASLLSTQSEGPRTAALLATSGVLANHPRLHVVFVEYNAGWLGWMMQTIDFYTTSFKRYGYEKNGKPWIRPDLPELPSFYVRRQIHATFQDDPIALNNISYTGVEPVLWGNDYPHEEGTYPHSNEIVARLAAELDPDVARRVFRDNAAEVFRFDDAVLTDPI